MSSISGQWQYDVTEPPTFDMEDIARLRAEAMVRCNGPDLQYTLVKLVPLLVTKNAYTVFLLSLALLEFSKHIIAQVKQLAPGENLVQESSISVGRAFSVADVLDLLEGMRGRIREGLRQKLDEELGPDDHDRREMVVRAISDVTEGVIGAIIEDIRTKAGFPTPELITGAEN